MDSVLNPTPTPTPTFTLTPNLNNNQVGSAALRHWIACGHGVGLARWRARAAAARELARLRRHHLYISARRGWACWVAAAAARRAFRDRAVDARWQLRSMREEGAEPQPQPQPQPQP